MIKRTSFFLVVVLLTMLSSCQVIGAIFKTGISVGIFIAVLVVGLILYVLSKAAGGSK